jgi:hypothetical protein
MTLVTVGVVGRRSAVGGEMRQSPRFSAFLVGVVVRRSAVGGEMSQSPRFSAFLIGLSRQALWGHCGHDERWFPYPGLPPFYCCAA